MPKLQLSCCLRLVKCRAPIFDFHRPPYRRTITPQSFHYFFCDELHPPYPNKMWKDELQQKQPKYSKKHVQLQCYMVPRNNTSVNQRMSKKVNLFVKPIWEMRGTEIHQLSRKAGSSSLFDKGSLTRAWLKDSVMTPCGSFQESLRHPERSS